MSSVAACACAPKASKGVCGCVPTKVAKEHRVFSLEDGCELGLDVLLVCMKVANGEMGMDGAMRWCARWYGQRELEQIFCRLLTCGLESGDEVLRRGLLDGTCWSYDQGDRVVSMSVTEMLVGALGSGEYERRWDVEEVYTDAGGVQRFEGRRTYGSYEEAARDFLRRVSE